MRAVGLLLPIEIAEGKREACGFRGTCRIRKDHQSTLLRKNRTQQMATEADNGISSRQLGAIID